MIGRTVNSIINMQNSKVMTKKQKYSISFQRQVMSGAIENIVSTTNIENELIASHIENSGIIDTKSQIEELQKALNNEKIQQHWGEIMGSQLDIFVSRGTVQIGYTNREIHLNDFKGLLEEWLEFITH